MRVAADSRRLEPVDLAVVSYAAWVMVLVAARAGHVAGWWWLLIAHGAIIGGIVTLPARGSEWERRPLESVGGRALRGGARFLRYVYPLPLMLLFFEEVHFTVNAVFPQTPYWFEPHLYAADRALFGELPAVALAAWSSTPIGEAMHALYFAYYWILIGGVVGPYVSSVKRRGAPDAGLAAPLGGMTLAFLLAFLPYPFLPARGPWENEALMSTLPPLRGPLFTPIMERIIEHGAVSGGCFPSAHVAGAWGIVCGLARRRRLAAAVALVAAGMSFACVYTRYHHGVDVLAGLACGVAGGWLGARWGAAARHD